MTILRHKALEPLVKMSQVAVNSFTSFHLQFLPQFGPLTISRSSMYIFVSGLGGHWDAEHCQGVAEGADKDCGLVSVHTLKSLTLCIYVPSQFFSDILRNSER